MVAPFILVCVVNVKVGGLTRMYQPFLLKTRRCAHSEVMMSLNSSLAANGLDRVLDVVRDLVQRYG